MTRGLEVCAPTISGKENPDENSKTDFEAAAAAKTLDSFKVLAWSEKGDKEGRVPQALVFKTGRP